MPIATTNPTTGETLRSFAPLSADEVERKLNAGAGAFRNYRNTSFEQRAEWLMRAAEILEADTDKFAHIATLEMGKTIRSARDEVRKCATGCRYYAENGAKILADADVPTSPARSFVHYEPLGIILAVMPWNFPYWQVFRFAAPALMAGNAGLLKHASNVPQCALTIEEIFQRAGFPDGVFQSLLIEAEQVQTLLEDERVSAATLTGSEAAGAQVASKASSRIKKTVLELGGSDPFVVMASADLDEAVRTAVKARTINNGQSCIAAKRFIVEASAYEQFERSFVEQMRALKVGDPFDESTDIGPLAMPQLVDDLERQVSEAISAGGRLLTGGKRIEGAGYFFEPAVLVDVPRSAAVYREEFFGPVAMLFRAGDLDAAIEIANDTPFGLGSSAWTRDADEQQRFVHELDAGQVFLNGMVASDARLPFGGVKRSGYGRELGEFGIREFVNVKTIVQQRA